MAAATSPWLTPRSKTFLPFCASPDMVADAASFGLASGRPNRPFRRRWPPVAGCLLSEVIFPVCHNASPARCSGERHPNCPLRLDPAQPCCLLLRVRRRRVSIWPPALAAAGLLGRTHTDQLRALLESTCSITAEHPAEQRGRICVLRNAAAPVLGEAAAARAQLAGGGLAGPAPVLPLSLQAPEFRCGRRQPYSPYALRLAARVLPDGTYPRLLFALPIGHRRQTPIDGLPAPSG